MTIIVKDLPLSKLMPSQANVRRTGRTANIEELAASISAHGLLQNLTVRAVEGSKKKIGSFEVIAGGRRLAALKLLAKRKALAADALVPCHIVEEGVSEEISLAENVGQCPMHPADQYGAFAKLHGEHGMSAEDIAARFGVTATVVKQRLKLGAVSPKLMTLYRDGEMNLEQLSAFTLTDDHDKQERVWDTLPTYDRDRDTILQALSEGQVASTDRRAVFVGLKAYEAAGGVIIRDLFDTDGGGFLADEALLDRLAREKLEKQAAALEAEGWKWVQAHAAYDASSTAHMRRVYPMAVKLTQSEKKRLKKLQMRHDALLDRHGEDMPIKAQEQLARIEQAIEALDRHEYKPADIKRSGVVLTIAHDGEVRVGRGFILPEDEPKKKAAKQDDEAEAETPTKAGLSNKLLADLTAHRTAALRNELALNPAAALLATVHALAAATFYQGDMVSCVNIIPRSAWLTSHVPGIDETVAGKAIAVQHAAWAKRLPSSAADLWAFIAQLGDDERVNLLAHCVGLTVDAVRRDGQQPTAAHSHADVLARHLSLDMTKYWQPTADSYLSRVSKDAVLEAVREAVSEEAAKNIASMKKQAMAEAAEQRLEGKGWLPPLLRTA